MASQTSVEQYEEALDGAGYVADVSDIHLVIVKPECFVLVMDDPDGEYMVGRFMRQTATQKADFVGSPDFEGELHECIDYIRQNF